MNNKIFYIIAGILLAASAGFWAYMFQSQPNVPEPQHYDGDITLTMYHAEGCDCCVKWAEYLEEDGIKVTKEKVADLDAVKKEHGVSRQLSACHTGVVDGYVVEGHVPAEDIRRLLAEQPDAIGISVPGMPPNSPGMDMPVEREYHTVLFDKENNISVFNTHH